MSLNKPCKKFGNFSLKQSTQTSFPLPLFKKLSNHSKFYEQDNASVKELGKKSQ